MDDFRREEFEAQIRELLCVYEPTLLELLRAVAKHDKFVSKLPLEHGKVETPPREGQDL